MSEFCATFVLFCAVYAEFCATPIMADSDICHVYAYTVALLRVYTVSRKNVHLFIFRITLLKINRFQ